MTHTLEQYSFFNIIAWGTVISFSLFVVILTYTTKDELAEMSANRSTIEAVLKIDLQEQPLVLE